MPHKHQNTSFCNPFLTLKWKFSCMHSSVQLKQKNNKKWIVNTFFLFFLFFLTLETLTSCKRNMNVLHPWKHMNVVHTWEYDYSNNDNISVIFIPLSRFSQQHAMALSFGRSPSFLPNLNNSLWSFTSMSCIPQWYFLWLTFEKK